MTASRRVQLLIGLTLGVLLLSAPHAAAQLDTGAIVGAVRDSSGAFLPGVTVTVIHEATHQIAFNCGLHTRYADNPLWLTEGMALYFETPDLRSRSGWRTGFAACPC